MRERQITDHRKKDERERRRKRESARARRLQKERDMWVTVGDSGPKERKRKHAWHNITVV